MTIDQYKDYNKYNSLLYLSTDRFEEYETMTRELIVKHLIKWRKDNLESFLYKNGIELLDEVIEMIREGKV